MIYELRTYTLYPGKVPEIFWQFSKKKRCRCARSTPGQ
jgi:hypothetical protein